MGECRFDVPDRYYCVEHGEPAALCTHAAADLERRVAGKDIAIKSNLQAVKNLEQQVLELQKAEVRYLAGQEVGDARILDLESRLAPLEGEKATLVQTIEATQAHRKAAPHGDCACQVCDLTRRLAQAEADAEKYRRYPFEPICLICGRLTPCMTEADLKPGDPGVPCTFDPTPKQLFEENAHLRERLRGVEAARLALESLTPGGSEYVNDPTRCVAYVRETSNMQHLVIVKFKRERDQAEAREAALREEAALTARKFIRECSHKQYAVYGDAHMMGDACAAAIRALSPDAGRALAAEVETLRAALRIISEGADMFDDVEPADGLHQHSVRTFARDALGKRGEEGK